MSFRMLSLAVALLVAVMVWWNAREQARPAIPVAKPIKSEPAAPPGPAALERSKADSLSVHAERPNSATAIWLSDIQRPSGIKLPPLPYPLDGSLDRAAARALYRKAQEVSNCYMARSMGDLRTWEQMTGTAWLDAAERARVVAAMSAAVQRQLGNCRRHGLSERETDPAGAESLPPMYVLWARTSAAASGDPAARAHHYLGVRRQPDIEAEIGPLLRELLAGEPSDLHAIGGLQRRYGWQLGMPPQVVGSARARGRTGPDPEALWTLVACDMGMDCGATSNTADRLCLSRGLCGYPDLEAAVRDGLIGSPSAEPTRQARQLIVAALRRGDIAAIVKQ